MLDKCWANIERIVQTASAPFNIFENKGNVWMLHKSLKRFKFDSTRFQQSVEHMLKPKNGPLFTLSSLHVESWKRLF